MSETKRLADGYRPWAEVDTSGWLHTNGRLDPEKVRKVVQVGRERGWLKGPTVTAKPSLPWE